MYLRSVDDLMFLQHDRSRPQHWQAAASLQSRLQTNAPAVCYLSHPVVDNEGAKIKRHCLQQNQLQRIHHSQMNRSRVGCFTRFYSNSEFVAEVLKLKKFQF